MTQLGTFTFEGPAGPIEALYKAGSEAPARAAVLSHPHPQFDGTMHNKVVFARPSVERPDIFVALKLSRVGRSRGSYDEGRRRSETQQRLTGGGEHDGLGSSPRCSSERRGSRCRHDTRRDCLSVHADASFPSTAGPCNEAKLLVRRARRARPPAALRGVSPGRASLAMVVWRGRSLLRGSPRRAESRSWIPVPRRNPYGSGHSSNQRQASPSPLFRRRPAALSGRFRARGKCPLDERRTRVTPIRS